MKTKVRGIRFHNPTKIIFGRGSISKLRGMICGYPFVCNILLVCGKKALKKSGYLGKVIRMLEPKKVFLLDKVKPNPEIGFVEDAVKFSRDKKIQLVVALGGGSVIDTAKVIALFADTKYSVRPVIDRNISLEKKGLPCIAIPTTAGTGSEVTKTASLWDKVKQEKLTVISGAMYPDVAIIDPGLTVSLGAYQTAVTGLDALSHAIESYWSKKANPATRRLALQAVNLVFRYLERAVIKPGDLRVRQMMSLASLYAGLAISKTGTTVAHSISYILTARFGVAHGLACAISLPYLIRHYAGKNGLFLDKLALAAGFKNAFELADGLQSLLKKMRLPVNLKGCGVKKDDLPLILGKSYFTDNMKNNRFPLSKKDLKSILEDMQ